MRGLSVHSLRAQVTIIAALAFVVPITAIGILLADFFKTELTRNAAERTTSLCTGVLVVGPDAPEPIWNDYVRQCATGGPGGGEVALNPVPLSTLLPPGLRTDDAVVLGTAQFSSTLPVPDLSLWPFTDPETIDFTLDGSPQRLPVEHVSGFGEERLIDSQRTLNRYVLLLIGGGLFLAVLVPALVWTASGRVLRPVEAIRREVADITEHDLVRRVPLPGNRNEFARLATTLNTTLDRLQAAVEDNQRFVADASHELRGPITALRAELEIATAHPGLTNSAAVIDAALADTYRLQELATDLLLLARLDHTTLVSPDVTADLAEVVRHEVAHHRSRHTITTDLPDHPVPVRGSHALLRRLLGNLLDNAERHTTDTITVDLRATGHDAVLEVVDNGPGIAPEDRDRVFDRFTRLDDARTRATGGTGLGLAIARRIATVHGGSLRATDHTGGARFTATIPFAPTDPRR